MNLNLITQSPKWAFSQAEIEAVLQAVSAHLALEEERDVAVVLSDDAGVQALNAAFRSKDRPTNVLSFPSEEPDEWGDIVLAYETVAREAGEQDKDFKAHFAHLVVHGMLHLLGYDHMEGSEAERMEALEIAILDQLGLANPYL